MKKEFNTYQHSDGIKEAEEERNSPLNNDE
jgi:hypothetical protein